MSKTSHNFISTTTMEVSLHDHKTCQCSACLYRLASETMLLAKESEINSLKNIIHDRVRVQNEHARVIDSNNRDISQLEKTVKDRIEQFQFLEHSKRDQINQLKNEIATLRDDNQTLEQSYQSNINKLNAELKHLTDENANLKQSLVNESIKLKQSNDKCELLKRTNLTTQQRIGLLQESFGALTEDNANQKLMLLEELDKLKQSDSDYRKEMKQMKQSIQQETQLKEFLAHFIDENEQLRQNLKTVLDNNQISENKLNQCKSEYDKLNALLIRAQEFNLITHNLILQHQLEIDQLDDEMKEMFDECRQKMDSIKQDFADQSKMSGNLGFELSIDESDAGQSLMTTSKKIEANALTLVRQSPEQPILVNCAEQSIDHLVDMPTDDGDDYKSDYNDDEEMEQSKDEDVSGFVPSTSEHMRRSSLRSASSSITSFSSISSISSSPLKRKSTNCNVQALKRSKILYDFNDCDKLVIHFKHVNCYNEDCPDKFDSIQKLNQHLITKHELFPYRCFATDCDLRYKDRKQLREHIYSHHSILTKFTCPVVECTVALDEQFCDYKHWNYYHLSGEFQCSRCDFVADNCEQVHDHQKSVHSVDQLLQSENRIKSPPNVKQTAKSGNFKCAFHCCEYSSRRSSNVIRHIRTNHFGLPPTMKEQILNNIQDDRDPQKYVRVVT